MKHRALALIAAMLLLALPPGPVLGAVKLDQQNAAAPTIGLQAATFAQSVTAGVAGTLTRVDLWAKDNEVGGGTVTVHIEGIRRSAGWPPDGTVQATGSAHVSSLGWYSFTLTPAISMLAGGHFAVVVALNGAQLLEGTGNVYAGGQAWMLSGSSWVSPGGNYDLDFKTYMNAAAPTPAPTPTHAPSAAATATATATPSSSPSGASLLPSATATAEETVSASAVTASPAPSNGTGNGTGSSSGTDWTLPLALGVIVLVAIALGGGFLLGGRRRSTS